jgi:hypothetical protein
MPQRKDLPPEVAAIALPADEDDKPPIVILNANEDDLKATFRDIRLGVLIPALLLWLANRIREWLREHQATIGAAASALSATGLAIGLHFTLNGDTAPTAHPTPTVITIYSTRPGTSPSADAVTPTAYSATRRPDPTTRPSADPPARQVQPAVEPVDREPAPPSRRATPTREPPRPISSPKASSKAATSPRPTPQPDSPRAADEPRPSERPAPTRPATQPPPRTSDPPPTAQDPPATTEGRDCVVRVDVDPLLDVCVHAG